MNFSNCDFTNEIGNKIQMVVFESPNGITVTISDSTSSVEHRWTPREASMLYTLLTQIGVKTFKKSRRSKK